MLYSKILKKHNPSMEILYKNAAIVTQNQSREVIDNGYVIVKDGYVSDLGEGEPVNHDCDRVIDLDKKWLLPGFVNPHVHLGESVYFPFITDKLPLAGYIDQTEKIYASSKEIGEKRDVACKYSLYQLISNGATTIGGGRVSDIAKVCNIPNTSGYMLMNSNKLSHFSENAFDNFLHIHREEDSNITRHAIFIHSLSRVGEEELMVVKKLKEELMGLIVMLHIDEERAECESVLKKWGRDSVEVLEKYELLDENTMLVHGNHLSASNLDRVAKAKASICHCLTSNMTVADKILDLKPVVERGINIVIGTDGPITGAGFDILNEARKVYQYQNRFRGSSQITPQQCLDMITVNAAKAIGHQETVGSIAEGKLANFVVIEPPFALESQTIVDMLIRYELTEIFGVILQGEQVVWDRKILFDDYQDNQSQFSQLIASISKIDI
jgi:cytosine/adenosine deaminase-related metal-dependent hydrolase